MTLASDVLFFIYPHQERLKINNGGRRPILKNKEVIELYEQKRH